MRRPDRYNGSDPEGDRADWESGAWVRYPDDYEAPCGSCGEPYGDHRASDSACPVTGGGYAGDGRRFLLDEDDGREATDAG